MSDIVERLLTPAIDGYVSQLSEDAADEIKASHVALMLANGEIERLKAVLSEAEKERDQLKKDLGSTNAALSICGYGGDTHAGMLAAQKVTMKLAKENRARAENAEAELAQARKGWQPMDAAPKDGKHCILAVREGPFIYSVQGAFQNGQWNAVHRDNVNPLYWMPNVRLPADSNHGHQADAVISSANHVVLDTSRDYTSWADTSEGGREP